MKFKDWLRVFRAQTAPATWCLILTPYLHAAKLDLVAFAIWAFSIIAHYFSFGHNSLLDTAMGYDLKDPNKKHHPLVCGRISLHTAHNVIHWGLGILAVLAILISVCVSPKPMIALITIFIWFAFGHCYNDGLSKESPLGFLAISICFTAMGAWGWFLSHDYIDIIGVLWLIYVFLTILFQISYSGFLKEITVEERSNILRMMGARVEDGIFIPGNARYYGLLVKGLNVAVGLMLGYALTAKLEMALWLGVTALIMIELADELTKERRYDRSRDLITMSIMEIATIFMPIPIMCGWVKGAILMLSGVGYFFLMNAILWERTYPRV